MEKQDYQGIEQTYEFDPFTETYERVGDMAFKRWYPTLTPLADGSVHRGLRARRHRRGPQRPERDLRPRDPAPGPSARTSPSTSRPTRRCSRPRARTQLFYSGANAGYGPPRRAASRGSGTSRPTSSPRSPACATPTCSRPRARPGSGRCRTSASPSSAAAASARARGRPRASTPSTSTSPNPTWTPGPTLPEGMRYPNLDDAARRLDADQQRFARLPRQGRLEQPHRAPLPAADQHPRLRRRPARWGATTTPRRCCCPTDA